MAVTKVLPGFLARDGKEVNEVTRGVITIALPSEAEAGATPFSRKPSCNVGLGRLSPRSNILMAAKWAPTELIAGERMLNSSPVPARDGSVESFFLLAVLRLNHAGDTTCGIREGK
ncbi:uncharacterized protein ZHAS_00015588 [Anopheles sinensis]|uniref:Uncharacterized protein n=1 Tax=Anopheles sinensis TaxID=74873 RepID=A0A084WBM2_ANOSI|nr:uncharacterized protein ZHAS_00015588 [Anopheles sinensis]